MRESEAGCARTRLGSRASRCPRACRRQRRLPTGLLYWEFFQLLPKVLAGRFGKSALYSNNPTGPLC